jgi:gamma-glutamyl-gamma-aminobutyrate hydrolase PuuD
MKIMVLGGNRYADWAFDNYESLKEDLSEVANADLILFTGGSDVDPALYGHKKHRRTFSDKERDLKEHLIYAKALESKVPMLGICRGAQFLTACQKGGYLIQDIDNHAIGATHELTFNDGSTHFITSTHHQMMYPFEVSGYQLIAWSTERRSSFYDFGDKTKFDLPFNKEPEIVFYPETKCLCIQGHPEMMSKEGNTCKKLRELIKEKLSL